MHLQNEFKLIKTSKCDIIQAYVINIWEMIIYLFTSETLQHIGTHINKKKHAPCSHLPTPTQLIH